MNAFDVLKNDRMTVVRTCHRRGKDGISEPYEETVYSDIPCNVSAGTRRSVNAVGGYARESTAKAYYSPKYALKKDDIIIVDGTSYRMAKPVKGLCDMEAEIYEL